MGEMATSSWENIVTRKRQAQADAIAAIGNIEVVRTYLPRLTLLRTSRTSSYVSAYGVETARLLDIHH